MHKGPLSLGLSRRRRPQRFTRSWFDRLTTNGVGVRIILFAACTLAACTRAAPTPHAHPAILSLNPCTDALLAEVATPAQIVALSAYSRIPGESSMDLALARRLAVTHGTAEEIAALRPDIVVDGSFTPPATQAALARLGIRLEQFASPTTVAESAGQVARIAALAGHPERGGALNARIAGALAAAAPANAARPAALIWQEGGLVAGPATLIADIARRAGFGDFAAARGLGQGQVLPLERVLADPPRALLTFGGDRALAHPALAHLAGMRRYALALDLEFCGGPTIIRAARALAAARADFSPSRAGEGVRGWAGSPTSPPTTPFAGGRGV